MQKKYDALVYIGRFQPLHLGHIETIRKAVRLTNKLIIVVGSAFKPRSPKNPFKFDERRSMIQQVVEAEGFDKEADIRIVANIDTLYDDDGWIARIQRLVAENTSSLDKNIAIIGHKKDDSTRYMNWFPQWGTEEVPLFEPLDATQIRQLYFNEGTNSRFFSSVVHEKTLTSLQLFKTTDDYKQIVRETEFIRANKAKFSGLPHPPTFNTSDAVVTQAGHILLIKRAAEPGKDLWALPGGYLNAYEDKDHLECMIRELLEETGIKLPEKVIRGSIKSEKRFDHKDRSERARINTVAFHVSLTDGEWKLPKVKGMDDAKEARWFTFAEVNSEEIFEDHFDIIRHFIPGIQLPGNFN